MEETLLFQEVISLIANLIGPTKWIYLARELDVYSEQEFDSEIKKLNTRHKRVPTRVAACLTAWRLCAGNKATVSDLLRALRNIRVFWLADQIEQHLEGPKEPRQELKETTSKAITHKQGTKYISNKTTKPPLQIPIIQENGCTKISSPN